MTSRKKQTGSAADVPAGGSPGEGRERPEQGRTQGRDFSDLLPGHGVGVPRTPPVLPWDLAGSGHFHQNVNDKQLDTLTFSFFHTPHIGTSRKPKALEKPVRNHLAGLRSIDRRLKGRHPSDTARTASDTLPGLASVIFPKVTVLNL